MTSTTSETVLEAFIRTDPSNQPQLDIDAELSGLLVRAIENLERNTKIVEDYERHLSEAREKRDIAKRQLQNAYLANGLNSDGTERKPRTKRTPPE